ncbi:hypothetical protein H2248_001534 [Termitomyces sp. 'cryptogamus']|nr:hypothetical protein H2248_001534 [Termitomyces sp. 'cryptogamus']
MSHSQDPFVVEDDNSGNVQERLSTVNEGDHRNPVDPLTSNARRTSADIDNKSIVCLKIKFELTIPSEIAHHLSRRETREFIESSLTRSILSRWNTQISEVASRFTESNVEITPNSMSIGTNTEPFQDSITLSSSDPVQTHVSDQSPLSSSSDTNRNTPPLHYTPINHVPAGLVPSTATPPLNLQ